MAEEAFDLDEIGEEAEKTINMETSTPAQNNRNIIIAIAVGALVLIGIVFGVSNIGSGQSKKSSTPTSIMVNKKDVKKERKRKKKIKFIKLFNQLEAGESSKILKHLSINGITFKTEQVGQKFSILVDEKQIDEARNLLAIKGLPAGSSKKGFELLDDAQTLGVTEFDKRIRFLRALSGELEKAITQLDIIESAKVQIVLPEQRLFTVTQPPVTSSIIVRVMQGKDMTDEIVFSIIQLVSNAVENLQPENVSVIDTEGSLLSDGIFERIAAKRAGTYVEEEKTEPIEAAISREEAIGSPIIPNYERIQEWFEIKWNFENQLKEKTERQLFGILPIGAFKVEVTSDIGPLENGNVVDIKRQTISVVIDGLNEDVIIDQGFKQQVFATVAGAVGYVRGRDSIQLSVAEFALYSPDEIKELRQKYAVKGAGKYLFMTILGISMMALLYWVYQQALLRMRQRREEKEKEKAEAEELEEEQEPVIDNEESITKIKDISTTAPERLARLMEKWISEDLQANGEAAEEETPVEEEVAL